MKAKDVLLEVQYPHAPQISCLLCDWNLLLWLETLRMVETADKAYDFVVAGHFQRTIVTSAMKGGAYSSIKANLVFKKHKKGAVTVEGILKTRSLEHGTEKN